MFSILGKDKGDPNETVFCSLDVCSIFAIIVAYMDLVTLLSFIYMYIKLRRGRETSDCHATIVKHNSSKYSWRTTVQQVS